MTDRSSRRRPLPTAFVALLLVAFAPTEPADASDAGELPLLASGDAAGSGWFAFTVETDGAAFTADIALGHAHGAFQGGLLEYHADQRFRAGFRGTWLPAQNELDIHGQGTDHVALVVPDGDGGSPGLAASWNANEPTLVGTYKILMYAVAEEAASHTWTIRGDQGVTIHAIERGEDAAMYTSRDFQANMHVKASVNTPLAGAGVRHTEDAHRTLDADSVILGAFSAAGGDGVHENELAAERDGFTRACPCFLNDIQGIDAWRAGTYTFRASGTAATSAPEFYLAVVHAPVLPG